MTALEPIRQQFRRFADAECRGYSDTYYRLALDVAEDDEILCFVAERPVTQPNLFFAAIHYLTGSDAMPVTGPSLRALLDRRGHEVAEIMRSRRTQTNEVGRCAVLLPALPPGPLALVEVGASAGLCLLLDEFRYDYGSTRVGVPSSPVELRCAVTGNAPVPATCPEVVWRRGLDINPIDVHDDDAVRWLLGCVWRDHSERRRRLQAAIELARADPPSVMHGDLVDDLPALLGGAPPDATLVIFHSAVLRYVSPDRREAFTKVLAETSMRRKLVWISNEGPGVVARIAGRAPGTRELSFLVGRTTFSGGAGDDELLALAHPHGHEMTWL